MSLTNAERQKRYRDKQRESDNRSINTAISTDAHACLKRIAIHKGISLRETIDAVVKDAAAQIIIDVKPVISGDYISFKRFILSSGTLKPQRSYVRDGYRDRQVRAWFKQFEAEGLIKKQGQSFILTSNA